VSEPQGRDDRGAAELVGAYLDAHNGHAPDAVAALYQDGGEHREIAQGAVRRGPQDIGAGLAHFLQAFPDAHWEPEHVVIDGPLAAVPYRLTGTLQARLGPFEPQGQPLDLHGIHLIHTVDGAIAWTADYWDAATFGRQMRPSAQ
jgi:predicted ester cyclase